jgi:hypothetical protein
MRPVRYEFSFESLLLAAKCLLAGTVAVVFWLLSWQSNRSSGKYR